MQMLEARVSMQIFMAAQAALLIELEAQIL